MNDYSVKRTHYLVSIFEEEFIVPARDRTEAAKLLNGATNNEEYKKYKGTSKFAGVNTLFKKTDIYRSDRKD